METLIPGVREEGIRALQEGDAKGAEELLRQAVVIDATDAEARAFLGIACSQQARHEEAKQALEAAIALRPREPRFQYNLGVALEGAGEIEAAAAAYREVLKMYPGHPQARAKLNALEPDAPVTAASVEPVSPWLQPTFTTATGDPCSGTVAPDATAKAASLREMFWRRFGASLVDGLACWIIQFVACLLLMLAVYLPVQMLGGLEAVQRLGPLMAVLGILVSTTIDWLYRVRPTARYGQTVGKMLLRVRVISPQGGNPGVWRAVLRDSIGLGFLLALFLLGSLFPGQSIPCGVVSLVWLLAGTLDCLSMLWDRHQQTWHDKIAGTRVVRA
jgi:uncharacterized RDD family membrane protein YckC